MRQRVVRPAGVSSAAVLRSQDAERSAKYARMNADASGESRPGRATGPGVRRLLLRHSAAVRPLKRRKRGEEEPVHEARVALRRLRELVVCLGPLLPRRETRRLDARMRRALALLGAVRDADVASTLCARLISEGHDSAQRDFLFRLIQEIEEERSEAQRRLDHARLRLRRIRAEVREVSRGLRGRPAADPFVRALREARRALFREARAARGSEDARGLHAVRLRAKHLRYLVESGGTAPQPGVVEACIAIQRTLGEFNDLHLFDRRIARWVTAHGPAVDAAAAGEIRGRIHAQLADLHARARALLSDPRLASEPTLSRPPTP
jgi:CHAD domain-containing protein